MRRAVTVLTCRKCVEEARQLGKSAKQYGKLGVGLTPEGTIEVWCNRHDMLVADLTDEKLKELRGKPCEECGGFHGRGQTH